MRNNYRRRSFNLSIMQANVGRCNVAHDLALNLAYLNRIDMILIQEPWIHSDRARRNTKRHPSYDCFAPTDNWDLRPRTLTYTRKGSNLSAIQLPIDTLPNPDLLCLQIQPRNAPKLTTYNIYNAPVGSEGAGTALNLLLSQSWHSEQLVLIAGDFNLKHDLWQSSIPQPSSQAAAFTHWATNRNLELISPPNEPTHNRGNTLDLTWASAALARTGITTHIADNLHTTSDHATLLTLSCLGSGPRNPDPLNTRFRLDTTNQKLFSDTLAIELSRPANTVELLSQCHDETRLPSLLDRLAEEITTAISKALTVSTKKTTGQGTGNAWWNDACQEAARKHRQARAEVRHQASLSVASQASLDQLAIMKTSLRRTVRQAKRKYWHGKIESASGNKDIFQIMKWHKPPTYLRIPPLRDPSTKKIVTDPHDKCNLLACELLQRAAVAEDIPITFPMVDAQPLTTPCPPITQGELDMALLHTKNSAPGHDGISPAALKLAWPQISAFVLVLFAKCLDIGWHPRPFRSASLCILEKPGKKNRSDPHSYRPIALLAVLGKGLERIIAKRLSWLAIRQKVLPRQQFGALPLRSATDLVAAAVHDIEEAWSRGKVVSMLTLGVQGALDTVLPGLLIRRLQDQKWPCNIQKWVASFLTDRSATIKLDGISGNTLLLSHGLPQGSPASPILFMLYIEPI